MVGGDFRSDFLLIFCEFRCAANVGTVSGAAVGLSCGAAVGAVEYRRGAVRSVRTSAVEVAALGARGCASADLRRGAALEDLRGERRHRQRRGGRFVLGRGGRRGRVPARCGAVGANVSGRCERQRSRSRHWGEGLRGLFLCVLFNMSAILSSRFFIIVMCELTKLIFFYRAIEFCFQVVWRFGIDTVSRND